MTNRMYYFGWNFFNLMWHAAAIVVDMQVFFILSTCLTTLSTCELVADDTMDGKDNMEKKTTKVAEKTDVSFRLEFSSTRMWYAVVILVDMKVFFVFQHVLQDLIHISWWMTTPWTARSTRRRRPGDVSLQLESLVFCSSLLASFSSFSTLLYHEPCCCHKHRSCQTLKCTHHQNSSSHPRLHWRTF